LEAVFETQVELMIEELGRGDREDMGGRRRRRKPLVGEERGMGNPWKIKP
jgi:hypothetical protein